MHLDSTIRMLLNSKNKWSFNIYMIALKEDISQRNSECIHSLSAASLIVGVATLKKIHKGCDLRKALGGYSTLDKFIEHYNSTALEFGSDKDLIWHRNTTTNSRVGLLYNLRTMQVMRYCENLSYIDDFYYNRIFKAIMAFGNNDRNIGLNKKENLLTFVWKRLR